MLCFPVWVMAGRGDGVCPAQMGHQGIKETLQVPRYPQRRLPSSFRNQKKGNLGCGHLVGFLQGVFNEVFLLSFAQIFK